MNERCRTCIHRDGCYDNDTSEGYTCDHYRNRQPQPLKLSFWNDGKAGNNGKNEQ